MPRTLLSFISPVFSNPLNLNTTVTNFYAESETLSIHEALWYSLSDRDDLLKKVGHLSLYPFHNLSVFGKPSIIEGFYRWHDNVNSSDRRNYWLHTKDRVPSIFHGRYLGKLISAMTLENAHPCEYTPGPWSVGTGQTVESTNRFAEWFLYGGDQ